VTPRGAQPVEWEQDAAHDAGCACPDCDPEQGPSRYELEEQEALAARSYEREHSAWRLG